jgi:hypothetical protein
MRRRRTAEEVARILRDGDRDLGKGVTVSDICRKVGIAETTYYRRRQQHDPQQIDTDRHCRELELGVDRLKRLVPSCSSTSRCPRTSQEKVAATNPQRAAADHVGENYEVAQRRISRVMNQSRSILRYRRRRGSDEQPLTREITRLARRHPRFGYRRVHAVLVRGGWTVNLKRVRRLWDSLGLRRPPRPRKAKKLGPKPHTGTNNCAQQLARFKDEVWTYDFIHDRTAGGRPLEWLTLWTNILVSAWCCTRRVL